MISNELLQKIKTNLMTSFEIDLFSASIENITKSNSPIRFNNFAYTIRELTRHILLRLSPDAEIIESGWYKNDTDRKGGISRKQRIYYSIHGGLSPDYVQNTLKLDVEAFCKGFLDIIDRLSKFTHIEKETFGLDEEKTVLYANETLKTLVALYDFIAETKKELSSCLHENVETALIDSILEETFSSIDILATHHRLNDAHADDLNLLYIDHQFIYFEAVGTIEYEMQWGSDRDVSVGDGLLFYKRFPFKCGVKSNVLKPDEIEVDIDSIEIETVEDRYE